MDDHKSRQLIGDQASQIGRSVSPVEIRTGFMQSLEAWSEKRSVRSRERLLLAKADLVRADAELGRALEEHVRVRTRLEDLDSIRDAERKHMEAEHIRLDAELARLKRETAADVEEAEIDAIERKRRKALAQQKLDKVIGAEEDAKDPPKSRIDAVIDEEFERLEVKKKAQAMEDLWKQEQDGELTPDQEIFLRRVRDEIDAPNL